MSGKRKRSIEESANRWLCHIVSTAITAVMAVFASDGAAAIWPTHPRVASVLAVQCAMAAWVAHIRFCAQFGTARRTQSRLLLGIVIAIFGIVSAVLGAIPEYRDSEGAWTTDYTSAFTAGYVVYTTQGDRTEGTESTLPRFRPRTFLISFFRALLSGSADAVVPFCVGCFLEILPLATLFILVRRIPMPPSG